MAELGLEPKSKEDVTLTDRVQSILYQNHRWLAEEA